MAKEYSILYNGYQDPFGKEYDALSDEYFIHLFSTKVDKHLTLTLS